MSALTPSQIGAIKLLAEKFGVSDVRVFGSVAKGTSTPESDLDLLVEFSRPVSLIDFVEFKQALETELGLKVDLVTRAGLSPYIADQVMADAVSI